VRNSLSDLLFRGSVIVDISTDVGFHRQKTPRTASRRCNLERGRAVRPKRLEDEGYIVKRVALVDRAKIGLKVTVFVSIRTNEHDPAWLENFARAASGFPEIVELYRMSGDVDYLLKVVCGDVEGYDRFYKKLIKAVRLSDVSSAFAMEQIKYTTELPIGGA
jgi:Lrp/AsnC family transcriptional regulator